MAGKTGTGDEKHSLQPILCTFALSSALSVFRAQRMNNSKQAESGLDFVETLLLFSVNHLTTRRQGDTLTSTRLDASAASSSSQSALLRFSLRGD